MNLIEERGLRNCGATSVGGGWGGLGEICCINSVEDLNRPPWKLPVLEIDFSNVSSAEDLIHSDEGLMLVTTTLEILYGGQFAFSTELIKSTR